MSPGILVVPPCSNLSLVIDRLFPRFQSFSSACIVSLRFSDVLSASVLDLSSLLPGFGESLTPPGLTRVAIQILGEHSWLDLKIQLMLPYNSLPRPPANCIYSCSWHTDHRSVPSKGELWLESLAKIIAYEIDTCWLDVLLAHHVFILITLEHLVSSCRLKDGLILLSCFCRFTSFSLFFQPSVCCFEMLLISTVERLILLDESHVNNAATEFSFSSSILLPPARHLWGLWLRNRWYISMKHLISVGCQVVFQGQSRAFGFLGHMMVACSGWFIMPILDFLYCSLPRPPDVHSHVVWKCFLVVLSVNSALRTQFVVNDVSFWSHLTSRYALSEGELRYLEVLYISSCYVDEVFALNATREVLLKQRLPQVVLHLQSRACLFFGCILVAISGRFGTIKTIVYGSLPRPPEVLSVVNFTFLQFIWCSSCPRCKSFP